MFEKQIKQKIEDKVEEKKPAVKRYLAVGIIFGIILTATGVHCYHEGLRDGLLIRR